LKEEQVVCRRRAPFRREFFEAEICREILKISDKEFVDLLEEGVFE